MRNDLLEEVALAFIDGDDGGEGDGDCGCGGDGGGGVDGGGDEE